MRDYVIAPGSRSAPLTIALARSPGLQLRVVYDERSAGYVALGLAQQLGRPVGLVCTSGTAAVNFGPAVVEAYYQGIPLLSLLPTDRPSGSTSKTTRPSGSQVSMGATSGRPIRCQ